MAVQVQVVKDVADEMPSLTMGRLIMASLALLVILVIVLRVVWDEDYDGKGLWFVVRKIL